MKIQSPRSPVIAVAGGLLLALAATGCTGTNTCATPGGPVTGALDTHCATDAGVTKQATSQGNCNFKPDGGADSPATYGDTMFGTAGDDDDCKYHVAFSVDPICKGGSTTFKVIVTRTVDGMPATGAYPSAEVSLGDSHLPPNTGQTFVENPPGTYAIGPIDFDASGQWVVRFHFYEHCLDFAGDSPHGHAAFFINVP